MRLPFDKPYRAFPELDRFSDEQCEQFARAARARAGFKATANDGLIILVTIGGFIVFGGLGMSIGSRLIHNNDNMPRLLLGLLMMVLGVGAGPITGLLVRDFWLRRALGAFIFDASCNSCRYSLLGLKATDGRATCPECGSETDLSGRGIAPEQLLATEPPP